MSCHKSSDVVGGVVRLSVHLPRVAVCSLSACLGGFISLLQTMTRVGGGLKFERRQIAPLAITSLFCGRGQICCAYCWGFIDHGRRRPYTTPGWTTHGGNADSICLTGALFTHRTACDAATSMTGPLLCTMRTISEIMRSRSRSMIERKDAQTLTLQLWSIFRRIHRHRDRFQLLHWKEIQVSRLEVLDLCIYFDMMSRA